MLCMDIEPFTSGSSRCDMKKRIIRDKLVEYKCLCGNQGEWNGKRLVLQLDHINGVRNDNRLVNLRFLCPNCHSQQPTTSRRKSTDVIFENREKILSLAREGSNIRTIIVTLGLHEGSGIYNAIRRLLSMNGVEFHSYDSPTLDNPYPYRRKTARPDREELAAMIETMPLAHIARHYNMVDNGIRRWIEAYGLKTKPRGFWKGQKGRRSKIQWPSKACLEKDVWDTPVNNLAKIYGVSGVAIHRRCEMLNIATPPRGYWNRRKSGLSHEEALQPIPPKIQRPPTLTDEQVRVVRSALTEGKESYRKIGKRVGCNHTLISAIHRGERYAHVI